MSDDDSSELSSVPSDDELDLQLTKKNGILKFFSKVPKPTEAPAVEASPPRPKREPSPPHEYVLADNPDIAVCPASIVASLIILRVQNARFWLWILANAVSP